MPMEFQRLSFTKTLVIHTFHVYLLNFFMHEFHAFKYQHGCSMSVQGTEQCRKCGRKKKTEQFGCWPMGHIFHIQVIYITGSYCHAGRINLLLYYASLYICNQPTTLLSSAKTIYSLISEVKIHLEHESKMHNAGKCFGYFLPGTKWRTFTQQAS